MSDAGATTRVDRLVLQNFRSFADLDLTFDPHLTVVVAPNGGGKTALLDALAISWGLFVRTLEWRRQSKGFAHTDVRKVRSAHGGMEPIVPTSLEAWGVAAGEAVHWERTLASDRPNAKTTYAQASQLREVAARLREVVRRQAEEGGAAPPILPAFAYYGTGRLWGTQRQTKKRKAHAKPDTSRRSGYVDCFSSASRYKSFVDWFERFWRDAQQESASGRPSPHRPSERLRVVQRAVDEVLRPSGWHDVAWDFAAEEVVAEHEDFGVLPVVQLSDGIRNVIGLVADLAHRCTRLNPHLCERAGLETPGVLLIDEVDMHLHPGWQQEVVPALRRAFPALQIIVTTHSPQVLTTVPASSVRILSAEGSIRLPSTQTEGDESGFVLSTVFDVDPQPLVEPVERLRQYHRKIERGQAAEPCAQELRASLEAHYGRTHPIIAECSRLIRLQTLRTRVSSGEREKNES